MKELNNATAVVTGAGSGIGRALAINLAQQGCNLALSDINLDQLEETQRLVESYDSKVSIKRLDVADMQSVFNYADSVQEEFGKVNLVINNAGVGLNSGTFDQTTIEEFEWLMSINFSGVLYGTKAFLPYLQKSDWGHIVNISSLFGIIGVGGQTAYNASKFAVRGMTEALRQELDITCPNVSCTSVHPGGVKTNIVRNSRTGETPAEEHGDFFMGTAEEFERLAGTTADSAAKQILSAVKKDKRRLLIGKDAKLMDWVQRRFPTRYPAVFNFIVKLIRR